VSNTPVPPRRGKGNGRNQPPRSKGRQQRQHQQRRNRFIVIGVIIVVAVAVVALVLVSVVGGSSNGPLRTPATIQDVNTITGVPISALVGASDEVPRLYPAVSAGNGPKDLSKNGKPTLLYVGAEFCPYCGAERWPLIIALSKFGTFSNLQTTHSAKNDGNIPTWSFYGSTYTSQYLNFQTYEVENNKRAALENPPSDVVQIWTTFFKGSESFPFMDFNQQSVIQTAQFPYTTLQGSSFADVLKSVGDNTTTMGDQIDGSAAALTRYICDMTNNQPSSVCTAVAKIPATVAQQPSGTGSNAG
jgi:hypothetical protein